MALHCGKPEPGYSGRTRCSPGACHLAPASAAVNAKHVRAQCDSRISHGRSSPPADDPAAKAAEEATRRALVQTTTALARSRLPFSLSACSPPRAPLVPARWLCLLSLPPAPAFHFVSSLLVPRQAFPRLPARVRPAGRARLRARAQHRGCEGPHPAFRVRQQGEGGGSPIPLASHTPMRTDGQLPHVPSTWHLPKPKGIAWPLVGTALHARSSSSRCLGRKSLWP